MSGSTSSTTGSKKVIAICQEINRLSLNLSEEGFPSTERAKLHVFFTKNSNNIKFLDLVLNVLNIISVNNYNERLTYLKELLPDQPDTEHIQKIQNLEYQLFVFKTGNTAKSSSVYRYVKEHGVVQHWQIESDIYPDRVYGPRVFEQYPNAPARGKKISEFKINQLFCVNVLIEVVKQLYLKSRLLVLGDKGSRKEGEVYADIIIGHVKYQKELKNNPPDLSKGWGSKVKNDIKDVTKLNEGLGQLIKYARINLTANKPLSDIFYGYLTDGKFWKFVKIQLSDDDDGLKVNLEESPYFEWDEYTASLLVGLISHYHDLLIKWMRASGEKNESQNNDKMYMYRMKSLTSSESLLASFIKKGIYIRLNSGNYIHVQITSHLGTGRECIVFLAQVRDYEIKNAVLKIEVHKDTKISQVYREISALHALGDLSCIPKILFEGYTMGGSLALLTDFAGRSLESWISDNGNIDDYTIFQIILDLLLCLEKIHACGYTHGDVAIRNVIQRNGHFYLIDFGLATLLQLQFDPCQAIIQDYNGLCQIIGIIKFGEEMLFSELIGKLKGELKSLVVFVEDASRWKITDEGKWLEKFGAKVKQFYERSSRKGLLNIIV